jgi:hypothetical protein
MASVAASWAAIWGRWRPRIIGAGAGPVDGGYWDTDVAGVETSAGGVGLSTAAMTGTTAETELSGLGFGLAWQVVPGETAEDSGCYPILRSMPAAAQPGCASPTPGWDFAREGALGLLAIVAVVVLYDLVRRR